MRDDQDKLEESEDLELEEILEPQEELGTAEVPAQEKQTGPKQTGRVNFIWILAGIYLLYTAYELLSRRLKGQADNWLVNVGGGLLFLAAACFLFLREWKAYQYGKAHKDDPESWSNDDDGEEKP